MTAEIVQVLLLEDNEGDAGLVRHGLADEGPFEVTWAQSLAEAEPMLGDDVWDVVLLDLGLPDADGIALIGQVLRAAPSAALVVLTGRADDELAEQALRAGAQDYFLKINLSGFGLARSIRYAIIRHELENELGVPLSVSNRFTALDGATQAMIDTITTRADQLLGETRQVRAALPEGTEADHADRLLDLAIRMRNLSRDLGGNVTRPDTV